MTDQKNLEVNGNILDHSTAEIMAEISQSRLSGALRLSRAEQKAVIYFDGGTVVFAASNSRHHRLFHILLCEEKLVPSQLSAIPNFASDQELKLNLLKTEIFTETEINKMFAVQVRHIVQDVLEWNDGVWNFNALVRLKAEMHCPFDLPDLLFSYGRIMETEKIAGRFKSLDERFAARTEMPAHINLLPQEAFVFSRFAGATHSVEEIKSLSGIAEAETLKTLYVLWLGGFLLRQKWQSAFSSESLSAILSARIELKSKAFAPKSVQEKTSAGKAPAEPAKPEPVVEAKPETSLEDYLSRVESAATFYEILDISTEAAAPEIKSSYFQLAKRFHPDLFYRRVEDALHRRIQNAFTQLAQAYETLRNKESREVYDFKLRKEIANLAQRSKTNVGEAQSSAHMLEEQAAENFEQGYSLLMEDEYEQAAPYLARAVHLVGGNSRYRAYYGKSLSASKETYRQAEGEFQAALRLEPDNIEYRLMLADIFVKIGLVKRAEGELRRILERAPNNHEAHSLLDSLHNK